MLASTDYLEIMLRLYLTGCGSVSIIGGLVCLSKYALCTTDGKSKPCQQKAMEVDLTKIEQQ